VRYLLIDRIRSLEPPETATAVKCVSLSDDVFEHHFPGQPVMPGALILEALAQTGGVLIEATMRQRGHDDLHAILTMVDRAKFRRVVSPGDQLILEARNLKTTEDGGQIKGHARVEGALVAEAELTYAFVKVTNPVLLARRREVLDVWLRGSLQP
jgi:beta-hydroxyacyl-ACP dehydratase FabZ